MELNWSEISGQVTARAMEALEKNVAEKTGLSFEEFCGLAALYGEGRLVVIPCKVGDTVWFRTYAKNATVDLGIQPHEVVDIRSYVIVRGEFTDVGIPIEHFDKTAFLTREKADAALVTSTNSGTKSINDLYDEDGGELLCEGENDD